MTTEPQKTILIAEDDVPSRKLLSKYLRQVGYAVIEATNGEEAVQIAIEKGRIWPFST
jgi:CheY-like chemotaxis protein